MCLYRIIMWNIIVLCMIAGLAAGQNIRPEPLKFEQYKVFSVLPTDQYHIKALQQLHDDLPDAYSLWKAPNQLFKEIDIMVAPHKVFEFCEFMNDAGIFYKIRIEDVQVLIEKSMPNIQLMDFDFNNYHTLETIYADLDNLAKKYPKNVQVIIGGRSYEQRDIKGVKVSFKQNNPGIFIEGGIHAREWISPATVMYILHELLTSNNTEIRELAESHDWYIFPLFNPDGYVYTHTTNRLWRKTRKPYTLLCTGSDPNRNWNYRWNSGGASSNPCSETYAGTAAFSDIETKTMAEYISTISDKFYAYISFHSYSQLLLFPYGHTRDHLENYDELFAIGTKSIKALKTRFGTSYVTGNIAETIYVATGSTVDYIKGTYGKHIAYTYELRDTGRYGFLLPPDQIIPTGQETVDSLIAMFKEAKARGHPKNV